MSVTRVTMGVPELKLSRFIAGFWRLNSWKMSTAQLQSFIEELLTLGISTMDHAFVYRSEASFGEVLKQTPSLRDKMEIITKFGIRPVGFGALGASSTNHYESSAEYLITSVDNSLKNLGTDMIDVLLIHRPDYLMNADEMARAFEQLVSAGKVRYIGVSNFSPSQVDLLKSRYSLPLATNQIEFSPLCLEPLENGILDQCQQYAIRPMLWSCLAGGKLLTGTDERSTRVRKALQLIQQDTGADSLEQVIFSWVLKLPCMPLPIVGTSKIDRIKAAISAEKLALSHEQWYAVWEASTGHRVP